MGLYNSTGYHKITIMIEDNVQAYMAMTLVYIGLLCMLYIIIKREF